MEHPVLKYDPLPWLLEQTGDNAVRARRALGVECDSDVRCANEIAAHLAAGQSANGSFDESLMKTAGIIDLCVDLHLPELEMLTQRAAEYLLGVLMRQPGYQRAKALSPGNLREACDLCGFFGPYADRNLPEKMAERCP